MAVKLTASQQSLIRRGLATPEDFGATSTETPQRAASNSGLTPQQQSLIRRGLATPEDFAQPSNDAAVEDWNAAQVRKENEQAQIQEIDQFLTERERAEAFRKQYDSEGPGLLGRLVDQFTGGFANRQADTRETGFDPFASQRIDPSTGTVETPEAKARRNVIEAENIRRNVPQGSLENEASLRAAAARMDSGDLIGGLNTLAANPDTILDVAASSAGYQAPELALMAAPGGLALSGLASFGPAKQGYISEKLAEASQGDSARRAALLANPEFMASLEEDANKYAATISAFGAAGGAAAKPLGRIIAPTTRAGAFGTAVTGATVQSTLEGSGEFAARKAAGDEVKTSDIALEVLGGLPNTAIETVATTREGLASVRQAERKSLEQKLRDQQKAEADAVAARAGTPTARNLAETFKAGVDEAAIVDDQLSPSVDPELKLETPNNINRVDRIPTLSPAQVAEADALASDLEAVQENPPTDPEARLSLEQKAERLNTLQTVRERGPEVAAEMDQLRTTIETAAQNPETANATKVGRAIDRLNFLEGRVAANRPSLTKADRAQLEPVTEAPAVETAPAEPEEQLAFDPEALLGRKPVTPVVNPDGSVTLGASTITGKNALEIANRVADQSNNRAAMATPDEDALDIDPALLAQFEANEAAAPAPIEDVAIEDAVLSDDPYKAANARGGVRGLMNKVAETEATRETPIKGQLARKLAPLMEAIGVTVEFRDTPIYLDGDKTKGAAQGLWIPGENKVLVNSKMNESSKNEVVLHEGVHSVLQAVVKDASKFGQQGTESRARIDEGANALIAAKRDGTLARVVDKVVNDIKAPKLREDTRAYLVQTLLTDQDGLMFNTDGSINIDEFISYGMTSRDVQNVLKQIPVPGQPKKSIWSKFRDAVRSILNFTGPDTVLDRLLEGAEGLLDVASKNTDQLRRTAESNRREAVAGTLAAQATSPTAPAVSTAVRLTQSKEDSEGARKAKPVTAKSRIPEWISNGVKSALLNPAARVPGFIRAAVTSKDARVDAESARELTLANKIDKLIAKTKYGPDDASAVAKRNAFSQDMDNINDLQTKARNEKKPDKKAEYETKLAAAIDRAKTAWGKVFALHEELRAEVDRLSLELIKVIYDNAARGPDGKPKLTPDETRQLNAIYANLGTYVTRSYAVNNPAQRKKLIESYQDKSNDPAQSVLKYFRSWAATNAVGIPDDKQLGRLPIDRLRELATLWDGSLVELDKAGLINGLAAVRDNPNRYTNEMLDKFIQNEVNAILEGRGGVTTKRYVSERADDSILKKREDVPRAVRMLMGEATDMPLRMLNTAYKQRALLETYKMYDQLNKSLNGVHVFDDQAAAPPNYKQLKGDNFGALANKWVHPDVKALLDTQEQVRSDLGKALADPDEAAMAIRGALDVTNRTVKAFLLLPNLAAYALNFIGSPKTLVATGNYKSLSTIPKSMYEAIVQAPGVWAKTEIPDGLMNIMRNGLLDSALVGEITQESFKRTVARLRPEERNFTGKALDLGGGALRRVFDLYAGMDLWVKLQVYYSERAHIEELNNALPADRKMTAEEMDVVAAEKTRETTFSYERAVPFANVTERVAAALFMRYTTETVRTSVNNAVQAKREFEIAKEYREAGLTEAADIMTKRATARTIGAISSTIATTTIEVPLIAATVQMIAAGLGAALGDDDDEEVKNDLIEIYKEDASWTRGKAIEVVGKTDTGYVMFDAGRVDPYGPVSEPLRALAQGNPEEAAMALAQSASPSPIAAWMFDWNAQRSRNPKLFREDGIVRDLALSTGLADEGYAKAMMNLTEVFLPNQAEALLTRGDEAMGEEVAGYRPQVLSPDKYLASRVVSGKLDSARNDARGFLAVGSPVESIAAGAIQTDIELHQSLRRRVRMARHQGMKDADIKAALKDGMSLNDKTVNAVMNGNFVPIILSDSTLNEAKTRELEGATAETRTQINAKYRQLKLELDKLSRSVGSIEE